jgi:hypothetical protein
MATLLLSCRSLGKFPTHTAIVQAMGLNVLWHCAFSAGCKFSLTTAMAFRLNSSCVQTDLHHNVKKIIDFML